MGVAGYGQERTPVLSEEGAPRDTHPAISEQELRHREDMADRLGRLEASLDIVQRISRVEGGIDIIKWMVPALIGAATLIVLAQRIMPQASLIPVSDPTTTITTLSSYLP